MIKQEFDGYIISFQSEGENDSQYKEAIKIMASRPTAPSGYDYRLKADTLEWELYELPQVEEESE